MVIELEEMDEEQLRRVQDFLKSSIGELENERDWRESEETTLLPLLQGLLRYLSREFLSEEPINELQHDELDIDNDEDFGELDF